MTLRRVFDVGNIFAFVTTCVVILCMLSACTQVQSQHIISIPSVAYDVKQLQPDSNQRQVTFLIDVDSFSYSYIDSLRNQLIDKSYKKCSKSSISSWDDMPEGKHRNEKWISELFVNKNFKTVILLQVTQSTAKQKKATQKFLIATLASPKTLYHLKNMKEFCQSNQIS